MGNLFYITTTVLAMFYQLNMDKGGRATEGPMLYVCTQLCSFSWTGYGFYVQVKEGGGFGGLCRNIAEDELASH